MVMEIAKDIHWVGAVDWELRHFHGYELSTHRGTSYNAYLIKDQKTALVDTVWGSFTEEFIKKVREVTDFKNIDYVVMNHAEPDHSGALPAVMQLCPDATIVVSKKGAESIPGYFHEPWNFKTVGTGDRLSLGSRELVFVEAPMLHWPDSMFTYIPGDNILLSNDAFGQHYATAFLFNDQVNQEELYQEALKYYANLLTPFSPLVSKKIEELLSLNLPVSMIAPAHGVIWRDQPLQIVKQYKEWAAQKPEPRAVIVYDTMWKGTRKMAEAIAEGLHQEGVDHKLFHIAASDLNDVVTNLFQAKAVIIGCPTQNNGMMPTIAPFMESLKGLKFKNKIGGAFGSYGWSGESVKLIEEHLNACKIPLVAEGVRAKWQPVEEDIEACRDLGRKMAVAVKKGGD